MGEYRRPSHVGNDGVKAQNVFERFGQSSMQVATSPERLAAILRQKLVESGESQEDAAEHAVQLAKQIEVQAVNQAAGERAQELVRKELTNPQVWEAARALYGEIKDTLTGKQPAAVVVCAANLVTMNMRHLYDEAREQGADHRVAALAAESYGAAVAEIINDASVWAHRGCGEPDCENCKELREHP